MSQTLLIALAASIPLALLAWAAAWAVDAMGASLRLRLCAWTAALLLPAVPAPAMLAIHALDIPSPFAAFGPKPEPVVALTVPITGMAPAPPPKPAPKLPIAALLLGLAGAGAALRLGQLGLGLRRVARLRAGSEAIADTDLAARLGGGVRLADTEVPVLAGLARPTILLPRRLLDSLTADQAALVCAHERAHLAAGDHLSHLMEETMVRLYWFNPFMAAAREGLAAAREEACDALALAGCDAPRRRAYAHTLIAALRLAGRAEPVAAFTGFRRRGAERRLKAILNPAGPGSWQAVAAAILAGLGLTAAVGGFSLAAAAEPSAPVASQPLPPPPSRSAPDVVAPPAPPPPEAAPPAGYPHVMISSVETKRDPKRGSSGPPVREEGRTLRTMVFDDQDFQDGHLRPEVLARLTPEERAGLEAALEKAHEATAEARAAMMGAHKELIETRILTSEEQEKVHKQVEDAMKQAHQAMQLAQNDGRVLMRCKLGADGKAQDCVNAFPGPVRHFELRRMGPDGAPLPPLPPLPPMPPAPPAPPPAAG